MKFYVYEVETNEIVDILEGENNEECERKFIEKNYDDEIYGATYSPAFGFADGLKEMD